ncbi:replicative DNA helicase [Asaia krungthepensis]|uniref:DNA 5'-3' helicase n=1 Tax=Asaia krungthepensis NRIC 0535 TaxID=1307925 RepID=A0ABQ0Q356_9PROT|nr:DnaB-like helicase C-terminal domain-containing protein [Asaia krungthepensis]GBQ89026.1 replicative DNA helicase [Asaia krungthepensis NRIC 0535]
MSESIFLPPVRSLDTFEAECSVLAGVLLNSAMLELVDDILTPEAFTSEAVGELYRIARDRVRAGRPCDPITIRSEAETNPKTAEFWKASGPKILTAFVGKPVMRGYAHAIADAALLRSLKDEAENLILDVTHAGDKTGAVLVEELQERIERLALTGDTDRPMKTSANAIDMLLEATEASWKAGNALSGIDTGYEGLNGLLSGLKPGGVYVIAARPGVGKSSLMLGLAMRAAQTSGRGLIWSGEMSAEELMSKAIAGKTGLPVDVVMTGHWKFPNGERRPVSREEMDRIVAAGMAARDIPMMVDDREGATVQQILTRARRMKRQKQGLAFIALDYLQLMEASAAVKRSGNRTAEVTEISRDVARMARELNVPVIALSQLNRQSENREDRRPSLADIRDSGAIEQDARCVMALYREEMALRLRVGADGQVSRNSGESDAAYEKRAAEVTERLAKSAGTAEVIVLKNRGGRTGIVGMQFDGPSTWFRGDDERRSSAAW